MQKIVLIEDTPKTYPTNDKDKLITELKSVLSDIMGTAKDITYQENSFQIQDNGLCIYETKPHAFFINKESAKFKFLKEYKDLLNEMLQCSASPLNRKQPKKYAIDFNKFAIGYTIFIALLLLIAGTSPAIPLVYAGIIFAAFVSLTIIASGVCTIYDNYKLSMFKSQQKIDFIEEFNENTEKAYK